MTPDAKDYLAGSMVTPSSLTAAIRVRCPSSCALCMWSPGETDEFPRGTTVLYYIESTRTGTVVATRMMFVGCKTCFVIVVKINIVRI